MSRFVAIFSPDGMPVESDLLKKATAGFSRRGLQPTETWLGGAVGLGVAEFVTTPEAESRRQPHGLDDAYRLVASCRLDSRADLSRKLGLQTSTSNPSMSDSELILSAYRKWGSDCVNHFHGDYSFVIHDRHSKLLFAARDPFGMKDLYHAKVGGFLVVGNSVESFFQMPGWSSELNETAIADYLVFGGIHELDKTFTGFQQLSTVAPGHRLLIDENLVKTSQFWTFPQTKPVVRRRSSDYIDNFRDVFTAAVSDRLRAPTTALLMSGGMDSTSIAAVVADLHRLAGKSLQQVPVFTAVFDRAYPDLERQFASLAAKHLGYHPEFFPCDDYLGFRSKHATSGPCSQYSLDLSVDFYRTVALTAPVTLAGYGGDSTLHYSQPGPEQLKRVGLKALGDIASLYWKYNRLPQLGTGIAARHRKRRHLVKPQSSRPENHIPCWLHPEFVLRTGLRERVEEWSSLDNEKGHPRHPQIASALMRPDWAGEDRYLGLDFQMPETRDPFLDHRVLEYVLSLPSSIPWLFEKDILRSAMKKSLPRSVLHRQKQFLGHMHCFLLKQSENAWVDEEGALSGMETFVDRGSFPNLYRLNENVEGSFDALRAIYTSRWITNLGRLTKR